MAERVIETIGCPCSCGAVLEGVVVETDDAFETRVTDGGIHLQDGHTIQVRGNPVSMATVELSRLRRQLYGGNPPPMHPES